MYICLIVFKKSIIIDLKICHDIFNFEGHKILYIFNCMHEIVLLPLCCLLVEYIFSLGWTICLMLSDFCMLSFSWRHARDVCAGILSFPSNR